MNEGFDRGLGKCDASLSGAHFGAGMPPGAGSGGGGPTMTLRIERSGWRSLGPEDLGCYIQVSTTH
jgi:hypothetical protein